MEGAVTHRGLDVDGFSHKHLTCHRESNRLYTDPVTLPCLDTYCSACLEKYGKEQIEREGDGDDLIDQEDNAIRHGNAGNSKKRSFRCPLGCETETGIELSNDGSLLNLPHVNQSFNNVIKALKLKDELAKGTVKCGDCKTDTAQAICNDAECANLPLCKDCLKHHIKTTDKHRIACVGGIENGPNDADDVKSCQGESPGSGTSWWKGLQRHSWYCNEHPKRPANMYCIDHDSVVCEKCVIMHHLDCKVKNVQKAYNESIDSFVTKLDGLKQPFEAAISDCESVIRSIHLKKKEVTQKINERYNQLLEQLKTQQDNLIQMTSDICELKITELNNHLINLNRMSHSITKRTTFMKDLIDSSIPAEFVFLRTQLNTNLDEIIRDTDTEYKTPEDDDICFTIDNSNVPDNLIGKVCSGPCVRQFKIDDNVPKEFEITKPFIFKIKCRDIVSNPICNQPIPKLEAKFVPQLNESNTGSTDNIQCAIIPDESNGIYSVIMFASSPGLYKAHIYSPQPYPYKERYVDNCPFDINIKPLTFPFMFVIND
jgi:hypothetical protein